MVGLVQRLRGDRPERGLDGAVGVAQRAPGASEPSQRAHVLVGQPLPLVNDPLLVAARQERAAIELEGLVEAGELLLRVGRALLGAALWASAQGEDSDPINSAAPPSTADKRRDCVFG